MQLAPIVFTFPDKAAISDHILTHRHSIAINTLIFESIFSQSIEKVSHAFADRILSKDQIVEELKSLLVKENSDFAVLNSIEGDMESLDTYINVGFSTVVFSIYKDVLIDLSEKIKTSNGNLERNVLPF